MLANLNEAGWRLDAIRLVVVTTSNRRDAGGKRLPVRPLSRSQDGTLQSPQDPLHILYQDEHIMVVNKPSGLLSVPGRAPENKDSLMTRIQADHPAAESVHRLDMATSGVIVVALNKAAERELKRQFREREPKKSISPAFGAYGA